LRLGAELINIPQMRQAFIDNIDLHTLTASLIYKIAITEVTKEQRQEGKTLNFALLYGMVIANTRHMPHRVVRC
jgi:twinkle protein